MFRTFLLSRLGQNIGRKGIFSSIHRPLGTKYLVEHVRNWLIYKEIHFFKMILHAV